MKPALALSFLLALPLHAELLATFHTSQGNVVVSLQYDKTPQAVANFITLAQGTRPSINPTTGAVRPKRYYVGETFYRIVNDPDFKIAQTGSGTETTAGGPGYTFRDEFDSTLTHVPYVLAMANDGPNTNGSQIYLTGNASIPDRDNKHTVFGIIPDTDTASRGVIDLIMTAGSGGTTINDVTFEPTSAEAGAFDEFAQRIPICSALPGNLAVDPGVEVGYQLQSAQPAGSIIQVRRSIDLGDWGAATTFYQPINANGPSYITFFDDAGAPKAFYNIALVTYPDASTPDLDTLGNRTLTFNFAEGGSLTFNFNAAGDGGTLLDSENPESGSFERISYAALDPYNCTWVMDTTLLGKLGFTCVHDSETPTQILGTHSAEQFVDPGVWVPFGSGTLTLSK